MILNTRTLLQAISQPIRYLTAFAMAGTLLLAGIHAATATRIAQNERQALLQRIEQLLAGQPYDNDPLQDSVVFTAAQGAGGQAMTVYRLRHQGTPVAAVYDLSTPEGYSGSIRLVVAVDTAQHISGARIVSHRETPGLGDKIERAKSDWILQFNGTSLRNPAPQQWAVRKDGGAFDQLTGATITPRAIVSTLREVLHWSAQQQEQLFQPAASAAMAATHVTPQPSTH